MDVFDRYLHAVRGFLPKRQQDDVVRELSEDLRSQVEDREAELGRPLSQWEQEEILKQFGHPLVLASRYQPQRHLVGPVFFPIYWFVLKVSIGLALVVHAVASAVFLAGGSSPGQVIARLATLPFGPLLIVFAWVTLVFALIDRAVPRLGFVMNWNPAALPAPSKNGPAPSMASLVGNVVMSTLFVLWLAAVPRNQWLVFGPAAAILELGPIWREIHLPLLLLASAGLVGAWLNLLQPAWHRFRTAARLAGNIAGVVAFLIILNAGALVVPVDPASVHAAKIASMVDTGTRIGFAFAAAASAIDTIYMLVRLVWRRGAAESWFPKRG